MILASDGVTAYACGPNQISIIDISSPSSPRLVSTFGAQDFGGNAISGCFQVGQSLVVPVNVQAGFVYDISSPRNLRSRAQFSPPFPFNGYVSFSGNTGWFTTDWFRYNTGSNLIFEQHGDFASIDFSDPAHPAPVGSLAPVASQPASSNLSARFASLILGTDTAYIFGTTATGGDTNGGQGAIQIIDISDPTAPAAQGQIIVPQATIMGAAAVQDNIVVATGNTKSWRNPGVNPRNTSSLNFQFTGVLTLSALDVSDPRNPVLLSSRCSDVPTGTLVTQALAPLGGGFFALSVGPPPDDAVAFGADPKGQLFIVDARDPTSLGLVSMGAVPKLAGIVVRGNTLYAATGDGLAVFQLPDLGGL